MLSLLSAYVVTSGVEKVFWWVIVALIVLGGLDALFFRRVGDEHVLIIKRLGNHRVLESGTHLGLTIIDKVVATLPLEDRWFETDIRVTTAKGAVVEVPVDVRYGVDPKLALNWLNKEVERTAQIIHEVVISVADGHTLDDIAESCPHIERCLLTPLTAELNKHGYQLVEVTVYSPELPKDVENALHLTVAMQRLAEETGLDSQGILELFEGEDEAAAEPIT